jgi:methyl-accepting chemotaxis protein
VVTNATPTVPAARPQSAGAPGTPERSRRRRSATQEIARNVQEAAQGASEVSGNIDTVAQGARATGEASANVHASALSLLNESKTLAAEVERFLQTVRAA